MMWELLFFFSLGCCFLSIAIFVVVGVDHSFLGFFCFVTSLVNCCGGRSFSSFLAGFCSLSCDFGWCELLFSLPLGCCFLQLRSLLRLLPIIILFSWPQLWWALVFSLLCFCSQLWPRGALIFLSLWLLFSSIAIFAVPGVDHSFLGFCAHLWPRL